MDVGSRIPYTALRGILAEANAALYWPIGWTLLGGHGEFTIVDVWTYLIVGTLLASVLIGLLTRIGHVTGIGVRNRGQRSPVPHYMRDGRYRAAIIVYTAYNPAAAIAFDLAMAALTAMLARHRHPNTLRPCRQRRSNSETAYTGR